jgi:MGT family glycosyltransferase
MGADRARHFGVLPFTGSGHLNPLIALALQLQGRGHKVTFFEKAKIATRVRQAGLEFCAIGKHESSFARKEREKGGTGLRNELSTLRFNLRRVTNDLDLYFRETETALRRAGVDALIVNEIAVTGPTVAELLELPYFVLSTSVPHNFGWDPYPPFSGYRFRRSWVSVAERALLEISSVRLRGPVKHAVNRYRASRSLGPIKGVPDSFQPLAQITQLAECLDLPRDHFPERFHYTGPFAQPGARPNVMFPWDRLDGRPLIYVSLGTTRNAQAYVLRMIAEACRHIDAQLVISLGGRFDQDVLGSLAGDPVVCEWVPQLEILKRATLVITHAGPNTVFESLMEGKPMVAIPIAHDQPAVAAQLARLGIGEVLPIMRLRTEMIRNAVEKTLTDMSYREAALKIQQKLKRVNGVERAADIIEESLERQIPVTGFGRTPSGLNPVLTSA